MHSFLKLIALAAILALPGLLSTAIAADLNAAHGKKLGLRVGVPNLKFSRQESGSELPSLPLVSGSYLYYFDADFESQEGEVSSQDASLWAPVLPLNYGDLHLLAIFGYRFTEFDTSVPGLLTEEGLHTLRLPIAIFYDHSEDWIFGGMVMPAISGDLNSDEGFEFSGALGFGRSFGSGFRLLGGVYYSDGFGEEQIIPGIALTWRPSPRWDIYLLGPMSSINYRVSDNWMVSLSGRYSSPTWNVEADSAGPDRDIEVSSARVGLKVERRFTDQIWAYLSGGVSFARELDIETTSDLDLLEDDIDAGPFLRVGMNLRF